MNFLIIYLFTLPFINCIVTESQYLESVLDVCIDSKYHKEKPGPEDKLHSQCVPWKDHSCCTNTTSVDIHSHKLYNFNYDHCLPEVNKKMSAACKKRFSQNNCFYECSPNIGPWIVKEDRTWRSERGHKVPLCASDCDEWFNDCKNDHTCTINWSRNFKWVNGRNICPTGAQCKTIGEMFQSSKNFCEQVWDHSWKYTPGYEPCMRLWFDGSLGNPNTVVAKWQANQNFRALSSGDYITSTPYSILALFIIVLIS